MNRLQNKLFDIRTLGILSQIVALLLAIFFFRWIILNTTGNLEKLGKAQFLCSDGSARFRCAFDFLQGSAQFDISDRQIDYTPSDSYAKALLVGGLNTLAIAFWGILLTTAVGLVAGIARLSTNWLVRNLAKFYVDFFRNTPLLLQLVFIFYAFFSFFLPDNANAFQFLGLPIYLTKRGLSYPKIVGLAGMGQWQLFLVIGILLAIGFSAVFGRIEQRLKRPLYRWVWSLGAFLLMAGIGWFVANQTPSTKGVLIQAQEITQLTQFKTEREGGIAICGVRDSAELLLLTNELYRLQLPHTIVGARTIEIARQTYEKGTCDLLVGAIAQLHPQQNQQNSLLTLPEPPAILSVPRLIGFNFQGGAAISSAFVALLLGLVLNTGANVAEIVRAGIQSVSKGQTEAAKALGLSEAQRLRLIVLPQALQVIIPPQTSQYLNLIKNSTLALAISYPDFWNISNTTINQSGRAIQIMLIVMGAYLLVSLLVSAFLNWYNAKIVIRER